MELRILRSYTGNYYSDTLQFRTQSLSFGDSTGCSGYVWSEWQDVPIVDEVTKNPDNVS